MPHLSAYTGDFLHAANVDGSLPLACPTAATSIACGTRHAQANATVGHAEAPAHARVLGFRV